ncbi:hypothetical protein LIER_41506 [Lithospermum erythrorhizon]|uniref:RNase H type-1 domain-containing protein n=1 Tax=Lithospermum erythrorhizon TaxID=34254 RepID=A0AAV3RDD1_LITER
MPQQDLLPYSFSLSHKCSNNMAEYQALILVLKAGAGLNIPQLEIYGDSQLIIRQLMGEYEVRKQKPIPYHGYVEKLLQSISLVTLKDVPRKLNKQADALAGLASSLVFPGKEIRPTKVKDCMEYAQSCQPWQFHANFIHQPP